MRKIHILAIAMFAVLAFSMVASASAFAESEWLFEGNPITAELQVHTEGELFLLVFSGASLFNEIACSILIEGDVGPKEVDLILDIFDLSNNMIGELGGTALACSTLLNPLTVGCGVGLETLFWVEELSLSAGLVWETLIELMTMAPMFLDHFHHMAFEVLCLNTTGVNLEVLCEGETSGMLENVAAGVLLEFGEGNNIASEPLNCLLGAMELSAVLDGDFVIAHATGGMLSVS